MSAAAKGRGAAARTSATALALACLAWPSAAAAQEDSAAKVEVGRARLAAPLAGRAALLIPVRYPIQLLGHPLELRLSLRRAGRRGAIGSWRIRSRGAAGELRSPELRRSFVFAHRVELARGLTRRLGLGPTAGRRRARGRLVVEVDASGALDIDRDGVAELDSGDQERQLLPRRHAGRGLCAGVPQLRAKPGRRIVVRLPRCGAAVRWRIGPRPAHGVARIRGERLVYRSASRFRGTDSLGLRTLSRRARRSAGAGATVQVKVSPRKGLVVRALGDSVTAGFGYYDDGTLMPFTSLLSCKPGETAYNDACSSNSTNRDNQGTEVRYSPDYGLSNNVSWAAQWANEHGVDNYENLAVSGSEPSDWAPGGRFFSTTRELEADEPDYVLLTVGANPLLSEVLFGVDEMGCAIWSDLFGRYGECVEEAFAGVELRANLKRLYSELVEHTGATIYLMQYHLSVPSSALAYSTTQIATMVGLLNREIASVAAEVDPARLQVIAPPHFNVGLDVSPLYPSTYSCSSLGYEVDGPSVQSTPTQDELLVAHPFSFCPGPTSGPPWVIGGDTGIHPSAAGYAQMASQVPAPR